MCTIKKYDTLSFTWRREMIIRRRYALGTDDGRWRWFFPLFNISFVRRCLCSFRRRSVWLCISCIMCCGNGAGFRTLYSDKAKMIGRCRVEQAVEVDADILVTSCPFCKNMLESQARDELIVMDLPQLVRTFQEGRDINTN